MDLQGSVKVMRTFADISNSIVHDNVNVSSAPVFPVVLPRPAVLRQGVMKKGWLRIPNHPIPQPTSQGACAGACAGLVRIGFGNTFAPLVDCAGGLCAACAQGLCGTIFHNIGLCGLCGGLCVFFF